MIEPAIVVILRRSGKVLIIGVRFKIVISVNLVSVMNECEANGFYRRS